MINWSNYYKWIVRFFSLLTAILLWYYVYQLDQVTQIFAVSVEFKNKPSHLYTDFKYSNFRTKVKVSGKKEVMQGVERFLKCFVDLSKARIGEYEYPFQLDKIISDVEVSLIEKGVIIDFSELATKEVPVELDAQISPKAGYSIIKKDWEPKRVILRGPANKLEEVKSKTNYFRNKSSSFSTEIPFDIPESIEILSAKEILLKVIIEKGIQELVVENVKVKILGNIFSPLEPVESELRLKYIKYSGPEKIINRLDKESIRAYIQIKPFTKPGIFEVDVHPQPIEGLEIIDFEPKKLQVSLKQRF